MDQLPRSNEGFANGMFADSQQYNAHENLFHHGADQNFYDASWGVNASNYQVQSRAQHSSSQPNWPQSTNHLSAPQTHVNININGSASPFARTLSNSPASYGQNAYPGYAPLQDFQYQQPQYDQLAQVPGHAFNRNFNYSTVNYQIPNAGTIAPQALQQEHRAATFSQNPSEGSSYGVAQARSSKPLTPDVVDQSKLIAAIPKGKNGGRFSIINFDDLSKATGSERMGNFLNVGSEAYNWDVNRAALPTYVARKSRNELRKLAANDPKLLARLGKKTLKERSLLAAQKPLQSSTKQLPPTNEKIKYENDSSSEESSSDDDESSYTSDDDTDSPLPAKRPDNLKEGTEYDTIKALWRGKRRNIESASIRKGLGEFWDIVKTIRDRWKADVAAAQDAESKSRKNELPLLESRVKDQRDMLETAFKAALKHGHRAILELMSENVSLLFLCYQFLLDRHKAEDYNSALPRAILETISLFKTITDDKLEKTHLEKVLPRYIKKGDAKTQFYAKRIVTNASAASKGLAAEPPKKVAGKDFNASSPPTKRSEPEPVAGVKRAATTAGDGGVQKKVATSVSKVGGAATIAKPNGVVKKPTTSVDTAKPVPGSATATKAKQVVAKPSGLFSSLQSAAKKPGATPLNKAGQSTNPASSRTNDKATTTAAAPANAAPVSTFSFAETMANLSKPKEEKPAAKQEKQAPPEAPEARAKRLRKESRRHLRVSFKNPDELVEVREFQHDPEEEIGHDASQVRDLADVGGEGRMFKQQHQMMDVDDDEDAAEEEDALVKFSPPIPIDFNTIDIEERKRNYVRFGGGHVEPESSERAIREQYEADTLMVFYTTIDDIPPNPKEPADPYNGAAVDSVKDFGKPEEKYATRARQLKRGYQQQNVWQQQPPPAFDLSKLASYTSSNIAQIPQPSAYPPAPQPAAPSADAINNILASLKQAQTNSMAPQIPMMGGFGSSNVAPTPNLNAFPAQQSTQPPSGQPDLAAILAQIQQNQPSAPQPPNMAFGYNNPTSTPNMTTYRPPMQQSGVYENPERKQWREGGGDAAMKARRQAPAQNPYYRTKVCKYWQEGRCQKGEACSYKHAED